MKWLLASCALLGLGCSESPYVIGRYRPADDGGVSPDASGDGQPDGSDDDAGSADGESGSDGCDDEYADALVCSGFEEPFSDGWTDRVETGSGALDRAEDEVFDGDRALHATTESAASSAVVVARFAPLYEGEVHVRAMLNIPRGLPTDVMNLLFLGDDAAMNENFEGFDVNVQDDLPQVYGPQAEPQRLTGDVPLPRGDYFCLRMRVLLDDQAGEVEIYVDDALSLSGAGLDTLPERGVRQFRIGIDWSSDQEDFFEVYADDVVLATRPIPCP